MTTAAVPGFDGELLVDVSSTPTKVAEVRNVNLEVTHAAIDSSTHDDDGYLEYQGPSFVLDFD